MKPRCEDCKSLQRDIYWTHFSSMHFCQILVGDFHSQLLIPKKFSDNVRMELNKKGVIIRGPSGITWDVSLSCPNGEDVYLAEGWQDFMNAHSLVKNDILIFKYKGNSQFDVLVFEGSSLCEKEDSYFVRKCGHTSRDPSSAETVQESTNQTTNTNPGDDSQAHNAAETQKNHADLRVGALALRSVEEEEQVVVANPVKVDSVVHMNEASQTGEKSKSASRYVWENVKLPPGPPEVKKKKTKEPTSYKLYYVSNRRPVTESEIKKTLELATNQLTKNSFLVVMRATHVYKRFYVRLPPDWMSVHLTCQSQDVILRMGERKWKARLLMSKKGAQGGLSCGGWQDFAINNNLEEWDVCLFKLASDRNEPVMFDITVFRVVDEVVPPRKISTSTSPSTGYKRSRCLISRAAKRKLRM